MPTTLLSIFDGTTPNKVLEMGDSNGVVKLLGNKLRISHLFFNYKTIQKNGCR